MRLLSRSCLLCISGWMLSCVPPTGGTTASEPKAPAAAPPPKLERPPQILDRSIELAIRSELDRNDRVYWPNLDLAFIGEAKDDDRVVLQYLQDGKPLGHALDCPVEPGRQPFGAEAQREPPSGRVACHPTGSEAVRIPGPGTYEAELTYRMVAEGTEAKWRRITFEVTEYYSGPGRRELMINQDRDLYPGWLTFTDPKRMGYDECSGIATMDMTVLVSPRRKQQDPAPQVVVGRCFVNGKQIGSDQTNVSNRGGFNVSDSNSGEVLEYRPIRILTEFFYVPPDLVSCLKNKTFMSRAKVESFMATYPGQWECKITIDGKLARTVRFLVDANGQVPPHPEQTGPGALVSGDPLTRFADVELAVEYDREAARARLGGTAFFGRPWKSPRLASPPPKL
jgi:hypothetical protein